MQKLYTCVFVFILIIARNKQPVMKSRNIIDKTNDVIRKQAEMNELIFEIKEELVMIKRNNKMLREENTELRRKLIYGIKVEPTVANQQVEESKTNLVIEKEVEMKTREVEMKTKEVEELVEVVNISDIESEKAKQKKAETTSALYEFFLGKNIIAKIASVLIFLGFVSFGQIAYINWLSDVGRVILILFVGIIFFIGGYFFEKNENTVFNNTFYIIGLLVTFLSITLAFNTYELIGYVAALYLSILIVGLSFAYFYHKRFDFLDGFLYIFYVSIMGYLFIYGESFRLNSFLAYSGLTIAVLGFGYILFTYHIKYKDIKDNLSVIGILYSAIVFSVILMIFLFNGYNRLNPSLTVIVIEMMILMVYMMYLYNYKYLEKNNIYSLFTVISSVFIVFSVATMFSALLDYYDIIEGSVHVLLFAIILVFPMYVYLFKKDNTDSQEISKLDGYAIGIGILVLIYSLTFQKFQNSTYATPFYIHNMVLGIVTLLAYFSYKYTKKIIFKNIFFIYFIFLVGNAIVRFSYYTANSIYGISNGTNTIFTTNDGTEYLIYIFSLIIGIALIVTSKLEKHFERTEDYIESLIFYGFNLLISIPIVFLIVDNFHLALERRYGILVFSIIALFVIGYRYLLNLKLFRIKYLKEFKLGVQMLAVLLIIITSFIYFDHDFSLGIDLFTFSFVLLLNGYLVFPLKELYDYAKEKYDLETVFIVVYMKGVIIQSVFIHRYINFTYDKVFLSSYFMIASALAILYGFRHNLLKVRKLGLAAIYFALIKFFTYDFFGAEFTLTVRMVTYFILGLLLMGIAFMYGYLEKKYGEEEIE